ncbi:MAG: TonB-dependent receptor [Acidobacteria bacterium]|nr:TonB-dependent receptor [Acidobacteriota bacterium]
MPRYAPTGLFFALLSLEVVLAQVTTATIVGTVSDESAAVLPGVSVTARNLATRVSRTVVTDDEGRYRAPNLPLGEYEVEALLSGFQTGVRSGITLTVGREAVVDFRLRVGEITERVTVTGEAPLVETTRSHLADLIDQRKIEELPLNGRSYTQLALLQPGVTTLGSSSFSSITGGGAKLSIAGARSTNTYFYLDGTDIKDAYGHTPGSAAGQTLGVDTIREFSVLVTSFGAEFGGSGGVINSITKSGTNELHGSVFEYHRNSALDARNFFDRGADPPPFRRNQFGFTVGGPIRKDRTFFFGSYEGLRERLTTTAIANVPTAAVRQGSLPDGPVSINPAVRKYLDAMPLPNGRIFNNGSGEFISDQRRPIDEDYFMVRVDHQVGASDSLFVRYTFDDAARTQPLAHPQFFVTAETRYQYLTVEENRILSPAWLNTFRFAFNRSKGGDINQVQGLDSSFNIIDLPGRIPPALTVPVITAWGPSLAADRFSVLNTFQFTDKLTYTAGRHSIRTGVDIYRYQLNGQNEPRLHGRLVFNSYRDFLEGRVVSFEFLFPGTGIPRGFRQTDLAFYLQDDFQVLPHLTLNLGLRWEYVTVPTEVKGRISNLRDPLRDSANTVGDPFFKVSKNNLGPRIGFAWDPFGSGKTSVRAGFGVFHQQMTYVNWRLPALQNSPFLLRAQVLRPPGFPPTINLSGPLPPEQPAPMQFDPNTPYMLQYNLTVQRQLAGEVVIAASYVGSHGAHLGRLQNVNIARFTLLPDGRKFWPQNSPRFNPAFGSIDLRQFDTNSSYDSLQVRANKRFSGGLQLQGAYTYAKNLDEAIGQEAFSGGGWDAVSMDPFDRSRDRGRSSWDLRHNFVFNFSYDLPFGANRRGAASWLLSGWQTHGILNLNSGVPASVTVSFNRSRNLNTPSVAAPVERPDLKPGSTNNPVRGGADQYLDAAPFQLHEAGTLGNVGRNTVTGPGLATFDLSLLKKIRTSEQSQVQFRFEFFNLFNRANFNLPNGSVFTSAAGVPSGSFGRITSTRTTSRQIQIALKFLF